jgi:uncharacterized protein YgiM (DUF1202 family)
MRGKVLVSKLNVREKPSLNAKRIGLLRMNNIVDILGDNDNWYEIKFDNRHAYAFNRYIEPIKKLSSLTGSVKANNLNVRSKPGIDGEILGQLSKGSKVNILAEYNDWLEISFNNRNAYVSKNYIELFDSPPWQKGVITATKLNVRNGPGLDSTIVGSLASGSEVTIRGIEGTWCEILFNDMSAFVSAKYVSIQDKDSKAVIPKSELIEDEVEDKLDIESIALEPADKLDVNLTGRALNAALTWNRYGHLLESLAGFHQLETACVIAVLCVESSGDGFRQDNQGRQVIRFENHKFWKYWGKDNPEEFHHHFKLNLSSKPWLGHKWRRNPDEDWQAFHGNQVREWQVLDFARELDDTAALLSISMGAPQIMGFNYEKLGYETVQDMFEKFNTDIRYHFLGFFGFLTPAMFTALRDKDFETFASYYNGSGQKEKYGEWIEDYYETFNRIHG